MAMKTFDDREIARRWAEQYQRGRRWKYCHGDKTSQQIHAELVALGPYPDMADIERIIGNDSWTRGSLPKIPAAPADPGIKPGGIRERAIGMVRSRYQEAA